MIQVQNLSRQFQGHWAVNDVSFTVPPGETLVLLGTSGSGKTTTLRLLNRLLEPSSGRIFINEQPIEAVSPEKLRRGMGYVLQHHGLFPHYTVAENIAVVPKLLGWPAARIKSRVTELLEKLQLPPGQYQSIYPAALSGGQKQRVGLARALAANPPILLMDEPFGALDPITRSSIRQEFKQLDELKQKTIVLVTHDVQEAFELGDYIGLMDKGQLVQLGRPADLLLRPAHHFVLQFLEQQRLPLLLKSVRLQSIWPQLPEATTSGDIILSSHQSLWEALDALARTTNPITVTDPEQPSRKQIRFADLQPAFANLRPM